MNPSLTILTISACVAVAMSGILLIIARTYPASIRGLREWSACALLIALSLPLFIARGHIPDAISVVLANLLLLIGFMLMNRGTRKFSGRPPRISRPGLWLFVLAYVALFVWFTYVQPDIGARVAITSAFTLVVIVDQLVLALRALPRTLGRQLLVVSLAILIASRVVRLAGMLLGVAPPTGVFDASMTQLVLIALPSLTIPLGTISLLMLASEKLRHDLEFISRHDGLTQCLNKNAALEELRLEIARAARHRSKLSVMLFDLDNFKHINDTHGHLEGDRILAEFAQSAKALLRRNDQLTRFGGDEFLALLPDADLAQATQIANRLHEMAPRGGPVTCTVSIGISEWRGDGDVLADLLRRADQALYQSKALGRAQTRVL